MTEFEVESMSEGSEPDDDSDLEVILPEYLKCRLFVRHVFIIK